MDFRSGASDLFVISAVVPFALLALFLFWRSGRGILAVPIIVVIWICAYMAAMSTGIDLGISATYLPMCVGGLNRHLPAAVASAAYNANNQLTQWGSASLTYDLNGNLINDGTATYTWNARNQLGAFGSASFAYDAVGRPTRNPSGVSFLYDGVNPVQELSGTSVASNKHNTGSEDIRRIKE